ncbi:MAG: hypothetical protein BZY81_01420 [SAR202 cluster bacterium Io17-Chloro-G4]|nr:MAG: hypothetical protein BZY81_01420 [SAR202 cluster bacterium Io17-Chloro-G4]
MTPITTVIFDMYETLVQNPHSLWRVGFQGIIQEQSLDTNPDALWKEWAPVETEFRNSRVKQGVPFRSYYQAWRDCFIRAFSNLELEGDAEAAASSFVDYISHRDPYPETVESLKAVQTDWRTAVLSNADDDYLLPNLDLLGIQFEAVLSSEKARIYKPLPGMFRKMLDTLNVTPMESVYVGDRQLEDVQGPTEVGMHAVWINRAGDPADPDLPKPAYQISSLLELPGLLQNWPYPPN